MRSMKTEDFNSTWRGAFAFSGSLLTLLGVVAPLYPEARPLHTALLALVALTFGFGCGVRHASRKCFESHPKIEGLDSQTLRAIAYLMDADGFVRVEPYSDMAHALEELRTMELAGKTEESPYGKWFATVYLRELVQEQKGAWFALDRARKAISVDEIGDFKRIG